MNRLQKWMNSVAVGAVVGSVTLGVAMAENVRLNSPKVHGGFFSFALSSGAPWVAGGTGALTNLVGGVVGEIQAGEVIAWNARTGELEGALGTHDATVDGLEFSRDGRRLVSASSSNGRLMVWDPTSRKRLHEWAVPEKQTAMTGLGLRPVFAVSPEGRWVAAVGASLSKVGSVVVGTSESLTVWDTQTGGVHWSVPKSEISTMSFSPDGKRLVGFASTLNWTATADGASGQASNHRILIWDTGSGKLLVEKTLNGFDPRRVLAPAQGEEVMAVAGSQWVWFNVETGERTRTVSNPFPRSLASEAMDPGGREVYARDFIGNRVYRVQIPSKRSNVVYETGNAASRVSVVAFQDDFRRMVVLPFGSPVLVELVRPVIQKVERSVDGVRVQTTSRVGQTYRLEYGTGLGEDWETVVAKEGTGAILELLDPVESHRTAAVGYWRVFAD